MNQPNTRHRSVCLCLALIVTHNKLNVSRTPQLEELVQEKVESGRYNSASEVVREALRLLEERDQFKAIHLEELRKNIAVGIEQLDRGQTIPFDEAAVGRIKANGRKKLAATGKKNAK